MRKCNFCGQPYQPTDPEKPGVELNGDWYCDWECIDQMRDEASDTSRMSKPVPVIHCHHCKEKLNLLGGVLKAGQVYFCSAECFHLGDGDAIEHRAKSPLPDPNSPFGHARQRIGELLIENAELKRQVDGLIKNGLSPEAKEQIEAVVRFLPNQQEHQELHQDKARMDWVEYHVPTFSWNGQQWCVDWNFTDEDGSACARGATIREAIDSAMQPKTEQRPPK